MLLRQQFLEMIHTDCFAYRMYAISLFAYCEIHVLLLCSYYQGGSQGFNHCVQEQIIPGFFSLVTLSRVSRETL